MKKINLVQTTHWDYEWYFTNEQSTVLFEFFMKELLQSFDKKIINNYILDGQMGILEKYLKNNPEDVKKVKLLVESGKLKIGPWFTQTDQMIISSESIVRNLLLGHNIANDYGGAWKMGYVPDAFGQAYGMPKIYNGFNINKMIFWRGLSDSKNIDKEFTWRSNDGSSVDAINIKEGYYSGGVLFWGTKENIKKSLEFITSNSTIPDESVLSLGGDQRYVDLNVNEKIEEINKIFTDYKIELSTYENYFSKFDKNKLNIVEGELLDSQDSKIHRSIYSHRYDHKYMNDYSERLLTQVLEPLVAMTTDAGMESHLNLITDAWRYILLNSAHDSAGGCNTDITNSHIVDRFEKAIEITESYIDWIIRKIAESLYDKNNLILFNTSPYIKNDWNNIKIITKQKSFILEAENKINFNVISQEKVYYGSIKRSEEEHNPDLYYYDTKISFQYDVGQYSFLPINIIEKEESFLININDDNFIESDKYKLNFENNQFNLYDKKNDVLMKNFIELISDADDGDTYDFSPLPNKERIKLKLINPITNIIKGDKYEEMNVSSKINLKTDLNDWIKNNDSFIEQEIKFKIVLSSDDLIKVKIETINKAKDHRLRVKFNTLINYSNVSSDAHYGFIDREINQKELENWKELNWKEEPSGIYPVLSNLYIEDNDKKRSMSLFLKGIKEYQGFYDKTLEITLYRSIGWLGKPNLIRRPGVASGQEFKYVETPDSQLLNKKLEWEFGISFENLSKSEIRKKQILFSTKYPYYQIQEYDRFTGPLKYFVSNKWQGDLIKNNSLFNKFELNENIELSILKQKEFNEIVIRLVNHTDRLINDVLKIVTKDENVLFESNMLEEKNKQIIKSKIINFGSLEPNQVKTYILRKGK